MRIKITILILAVAVRVLNGQQGPIAEGYFTDRYALSPAYAGNFSLSYLSLAYTSGWIGTDGGPVTLSVSYNDKLPFMKGAGFGGKMLLDKAGIFRQLFVAGSYSYGIEAGNGHSIMFGLSGGIWQVSVDAAKYYSDPSFNVDPVLLNGNIRSKIKFLSEASAVWKYKGAEAGITFSNMTFGNAQFTDVPLSYNPLSLFTVHALYEVELSDSWNLTPAVLVRSAEGSKMITEVAARGLYMNKVWGTVMWRSTSTLGMGIGGTFLGGVDLGYSFAIGTNVNGGALNTHNITLGISIAKLADK
jgi:type IX secretion system PorP/SprF family membrane protein